MTLMNRLISASGIKKPNIIGQGKQCFYDPIISKDHVLLAGNFQMTESAVQNVIQQTEKLNKNRVAITQLCDYKITHPGYWPDGYILETLAPGTQLNTEKRFRGLNEVLKNNLNQLTKQPLEFLHKWLFDYYDIIDAGLVIDTHASNLFYSPEKMTYIDIVDKSILDTRASDIMDMYYGEDEPYAEMLEMRGLNVMYYLKDKAKNQPDSITNDITEMIFSGSEDLINMYPELEMKLYLAQKWVQNVMRRYGKLK